MFTCAAACQNPYNLTHKMTYTEWLLHSHKVPTENHAEMTHFIYFEFGTEFGILKYLLGESRHLIWLTEKGMKKSLTIKLLQSKLREDSHETLNGTCTSDWWVRKPSWICIF